MDHFSYQDIVDLPYEKSTRHPHMTAIKRAAQFSPYAALTGYSDVVTETERLTDDRILQDEGERDLMDVMLQGLLQDDPSQALSFLVFVPDALKEGGSYETVSGQVKSLSPEANILLLADGRSFPLSDILTVRPLN